MRRPNEPTVDAFGAFDRWGKKILASLEPFTRLSSAFSLGRIELIMLLLYVANVTCLALRTGYDDFSSTKVIVLKALDTAFSVIYLVEILSSGANKFGQAGSLSKTIQLLDLSLVLANIFLLVAFFQGINQTHTDISLLPFRCCIRILRPFFFTTRFVNVRLFVVSVSKCLLRLNEVMLLLLLFLLWFGIAGAFQFGGLLQNRCVSDFYSLAAQTPAKQDTFFGPASTHSGQATKFNSSLYVSNLRLPFSSYLSPSLIFSEIITDPNISELMVVQAVSSFASAFVSLNGYTLTDFVCGSALLSGSPTVLEAVTVLLTPMQSPVAAGEEGEHVHYVRRPAVVRDVSNHSSDKLRSNVTVSTTRSHSLAAPHKSSLSWDNMDVLNGSQLLQILIQTFQLDPTDACSMQQTCDLTPGTALHGFICPYSYTCLPDVYNPYNGSVSFDNIGMSMLTLQTAISGQLWYELLFWQRDCTDVFAYFFMPQVIFFGGYIIIKLILVTLTKRCDEASD